MIETSTKHSTLNVVMITETRGPSLIGGQSVSSRAVHTLMNDNESKTLFPCTSLMHTGLHPIRTNNWSSCLIATCAPSDDASLSICTEDTVTGFPSPLGFDHCPQTSYVSLHTRNHPFQLHNTRQEFAFLCRLHSAPGAIRPVAALLESHRCETGFLRKQHFVHRKATSTTTAAALPNAECRASMADAGFVDPQTSGPIC